jgi:hypothetical protein
MPDIIIILTNVNVFRLKGMLISVVISSIFRKIFGLISILRKVNLVIVAYNEMRILLTHHIVYLFLYEYFLSFL